MRFSTSTSYNVFLITPALSFTSEKDYRDGGLSYAYFSLGWGYWSIDLWIKNYEPQDKEEDEKFNDYDF